LYKAPFPGITADTLVFIFKKEMAERAHEMEISEYGHATVRRKQADISLHPEHRFEYKIDSQQDRLSQRLAVIPTVRSLSEMVSCTSGFGGKSQLITTSQESTSQIRTLKGDSIGRYEHRKEYWFEFARKNITGRTTDKQKLAARPKILLRKTGDS